MSPDLQRALLGVIEDQLASPQTPEVRAEYERLVALGYSEVDAKRMMAAVVAPRISQLVLDDAPFNYPDYLRDLRALPAGKA